MNDGNCINMVSFRTARSHGFVMALCYNIILLSCIVESILVMSVWR